jgi:hypothetical protein
VGYKHYLKFSLTYPCSVQPRDNLDRFCASEGIPKDLSARIRRMEGAHVVRAIISSYNLQLDHIAVVEWAGKPATVDWCCGTF